MAFFMPPIFVFNLYSDYIRRKSARQESSTAVLRTMAVSSHGHFRLAVTAIGKGNDLFDTLRWIHDINPKYKLALRYRLFIPTQLWLYAY